VVAGAAWLGRGTDGEAVGPAGIHLGISQGRGQRQAVIRRPHHGVRTCVGGH
jgi:hypothetical protein